MAALSRTDPWRQRGARIAADLQRQARAPAEHAARLREGFRRAGLDKRLDVAIEKQREWQRAVVNPVNYITPVIRGRKQLRWTPSARRSRPILPDELFHLVGEILHLRYGYGQSVAHAARLAQARYRYWEP